MKFILILLLLANICYGACYAVYILENSMKIELKEGIRVKHLLLIFVLPAILIVLLAVFLFYVYEAIESLLNKKIFK